MGTRGQFTTQSGTTIEGGPGLVLDVVLDVPRDNVLQGVDCRHVLIGQRRHVGLLELALLGEHVVITRVLIVGVCSAVCVVTLPPQTCPSWRPPRRTCFWPNVLASPDLTS